MKNNVNRRISYSARALIYIETLVRKKKKWFLLLPYLFKMLKCYFYYNVGSGRLHSPIKFKVLFNLNSALMYMQNKMAPRDKNYT